MTADALVATAIDGLDLTTTDGLSSAFDRLVEAARPRHDPPDADALLGLLRILYAVGRRDLPLGRLFEGHVDAVQIVHRYGDDAQTSAVTGKCVRAGVWTAGRAGEPLRFDHGVLDGGKAFASGAGILTHALVTADSDAGTRLILVDLGTHPPDIDRGWWRTLGMQRSETHLVRWSGAPIGETFVIGSPADYVREPWFSGGALRFVAVQAGGVAALFDRTRDHLVVTERAADPHQQTRLASLFAAAQSAAGAVRDAAGALFDRPVEAGLAHVAAARAAVAAAGDRAITLAEQSVGLSGLFLSHPLAGLIADLSTYLRQPAPDAHRMRVAQAAAAGLITPAL